VVQWLELMLAVAAMVACAGPPAEPQPLVLAFPYTDADTSGIEDPAALARSVAATYVKVTVLRPVDTENERHTASTPRTVGGASGILVDPAGYVVTAAHIARSTAFEARVTASDGREYPARILKVDRAREMALIRIAGAGRRFAVAEPADGARVDQPALALGTPDNRPGAVSVGRVTVPRLEGRVAYGGFAYDNPMQLAIDIDPGFSGGPVFDARGRLLGMIIGFDLQRNESGELTRTGSAYAIPAGALLDAARTWKAALEE